jgi:hypothetical protein
MSEPYGACARRMRHTHLTPDESCAGKRANECTIRSYVRRVRLTRRGQSIERCVYAAAMSVQAKCAPISLLGAI